MIRCRVCDVLWPEAESTTCWNCDFFVGMKEGPQGIGIWPFPTHPVLGNNTRYMYRFGIGMVSASVTGI